MGASTRSAYVERPNGGVCAVEILEDGRIISSSAVSCVFSGTPRFDTWFRRRYGPLAVVEFNESVWGKLTRSREKVCERAVEPVV